MSSAIKGETCVHISAWATGQNELENFGISDIGKNPISCIPNVNHMLRPSQSPNVNPVKHLGEILEQGVRQRSSPHQDTKWGHIV